ncbi:hypothetical protein GCM10009660_02510 [Catellatospora bangladeshensis]
MASATTSDAKYGHVPSADGSGTGGGPAGAAADCALGALDGTGGVVAVVGPAVPHAVSAPRTSKDGRALRSARFIGRPVNQNSNS